MDPLEDQPEPQDPIGETSSASGQGEHIAADQNWQNQTGSEAPFYQTKTISLVISSLAIVCCVLTMMGLVILERLANNETKNTGKGAGAEIHLNSKIAHGMHQLEKLAKTSAKKEKKNKKASANTKQILDGMNKGPVAQRMARAVLLAEIEGSSSGLEAVKEVKEAADKEGYQFSEFDTKIFDSTRRVLYSSLQEDEKKEFPGIKDAQKEDYEFLKEEIYFAGDVAKVLGKPSTSPEKKEVESSSFFSLIGVSVLVLVGISAIAIGTFIFLPTVLVFLSTGRLKTYLETPSANSFLYLESFAVWIVGFLGLQIFSGILFAALGLNPAEWPKSAGFALNLVIFYFPMIFAYLWLRFRHWDTKTLHKEAGFCSHGIFKDVFCGFTTYLSCLPLIGLGFGITMVLTLVFASEDAGATSFHSPNKPDHPIQQMVTDGSFFTIFSVFFMAAVSAPIVEEIVFRGLFYRYLRDFTRPDKSRSWLFSVIVASMINGFVFAAIHPQGMLAIPVLMTMGMAMCYAREWREGLIAPMTMHAIHNGAISLGLTFMM